MREEIKILPQELRAIATEAAAQNAQDSSGPAPPVTVTAQADEETKDTLMSIDDTVKRIEEQGERNAQGLTGIHAKVDAIMSLQSSKGGGSRFTAPANAVLGEVGQAQAPLFPSQGVDTDAVMSKLEEVKAELKSELPALAERLEALIGAKLASGSATQSIAIPKSGEGETDGGTGEVITMANVGSSTGTVSPEDVAHITSKLDELLAAYKIVKEGGDGGSGSIDGGGTVNEKVCTKLYCLGRV